ncbi:MAG: hypothetical protein WBH86_04440 [Thermogutta sp.]|nr:hypothetical protein [Thermogutta sp.]HPZ82309.1 hypothetical protein [Thermogutta sp.]HQF13254.1 hypothetical protein [Thermogutta sp.]
MQRKEILAKVAAGELTPEEADRLLAELDSESAVLTCKVSPKGAVSVYGLQRMPVTLYADQWHRLLAFGDDIRRFIEEHREELRWRVRPEPQVETQGEPPKESTVTTDRSVASESGVNPDSLESQGCD